MRGVISLLSQYALMACMDKNLFLNKNHKLCPDCNKWNYRDFFGGDNIYIIKILSRVCVTSSETGIHIH